MSRLGMLYALSVEEIDTLKALPEDERFVHTLKEYEPAFLGTPRAHEFQQAWEGMHYIFCDGYWIEDNAMPHRIIFGGDEVILDDDDVIIRKKHESLKEIVEYLEALDLKALIWKTTHLIPEDAFDFPLDEDFMYYVFNWCEEMKDFYRYAYDNGYDVLFTVAL